MTSRQEHNGQTIFSFYMFSYSLWYDSQLYNDNGQEDEKGAAEVCCQHAVTFLWVLQHTTHRVSTTGIRRATLSHLHLHKYVTHLLLDVRSPEGQQERLAVLCPQTVDATCINGSHQVFIHLILRVLFFHALPKPHSDEQCTLTACLANKLTNILTDLLTH